MIYLGVNIDHIATIRQARHTRYPDPVAIALQAEVAGADGITLHLREDRRHIQERDVELLKASLQTRMNLEIAVTSAMVDYALTIKPEHCCLVPEKREELTTEGGLDVVNHVEKITAATQTLQAQGVEVSLFIDPCPHQIECAIATGAEAIELHTGDYANASADAQRECLDKILQAVRLASAEGLIVNAGHGLHYHNVQAIAQIPEIHELNIGHAIVARAFYTGIEQAVRDMKDLMLQARAIC